MRTAALVTTSAALLLMGPLPLWAKTVTGSSKTLKTDRPKPKTVAAAQVTSLSCGFVNNGRLARAVTLPPNGPGYRIVSPWLERGLHHGTKQLVALIRRAAAAVDAAHPGAVLGVADLSLAKGGPAPRHRSHQSGRDVDLIYYALDADSKPVAPSSCMPAYGPDGWARRCYYPSNRAIAPRRFDVERNWALIRALIADPKVRIRVIFTSLAIRKRLLAYAARKGEPRQITRRAEGLMQRPPRGRAHTDHMHVRVGCSLNDRRRGRCRPDPQKPRKPRYWARCSKATLD